MVADTADKRRGTRIMRFMDNNGNRYQADTKVGLVYELYKRSWNKVHCIDIDDWVSKCAKRIWEQYDIAIEYRSYDDFVDELITYKLIKEIN